MEIGKYCTDITNTIRIFLCVVTLWLYQKNTTFKAMPNNIHEIYRKDSEQRIKTAQLKNSLPVELTMFFKKANLTINTSTNKCT